MHQSSFRLSSAAKRTLFVSGIGFLAASMAACDPKADATAVGQVSQAITADPGSPVSVATRPAHVKPSRATKHDWRISKSAGSSGPSLRAAYIRSVQSEGGSQYAARVGHSGSVSFDSQDHKLAAQATAQGLRFDAGSAADKTSATFRLLSYGCVGESSTRFAGVAPVAHGNRVSYVRGGVTEWYQNGRLGVEQGFDLQTAPGCRASSREEAVELKIALDHSLRASLSSDKDAAQSLQLRDEARDTVLHYSDLFAVDADGKNVPVKMALNESGTELTLRVDDRGARYPLTIDPLIWAQVGLAVKAGDPDANDAFGFSIASAGDTAVVGATLDDAGGTDAGAIYVFTMNSQGTWTQRVKVDGPSAGANYGWSVGITKLPAGDYRIVAGAPEDSSGSGLANWFRGAGDSWVAEAEFSGAGKFGFSVAVSGDRVVVGAPNEAGLDGVARIYEPDPRLMPIPWNEAGVIASATPGTQGSIGVGVAIDGDIAVVGEPSFDVGATDDGRAFIYQRNPVGGWNRVATLTASDRMALTNFGYFVAVQGLTAVIGGPNHNSAAGAAYTFDGIAGTWAQTSRLHSLAGVTLSAGGQFGHGVSIRGNTLVVGAPSAAGTERGFVFSRAAGTWSLTQSFVPKAGGSGAFARALSLGTPGHILATAPLESTTATSSGAFFDFILRKQNGDACAAASECASDFCVDGVCCNNACGGGVTTDCDACSTAMGAATNGTCGPASNTTVCRPAAGGCDLAETCDGTTNVCPTDAFRPSTFECRGVTGACDVAENCSGTSAQCPTDAIRPAQFACRVAAGDCDVAELCDGQTKVCPADQLKPSFTICRLPAGECDQAEVCTGADVNCPQDITMTVGTTCSTGSCQAGGMCRVEADLGIALSGPPSVQPQQDLVYTATVTNFGRSPASNVEVSITLPMNAPVLATSGSGVTCQSTNNNTKCTVASLAPAQSTNISLQVKAPSGADRMTVDAVVSSTVFDPNPANNSAKLDQNLLSPRIAGGGCSAAPGTQSSAPGFAAVASLLGLLLASRRRRENN